MRFILIAFALLIYFPANSQDTLQYLSTLPNDLNETSALVFYNETFWTINDSGGEPILYSFNREGKLVREVQIKGVENYDWEALAINSTHIFIGDFGNNFGSRNNLKVYAVKLNQLTKSEAKVDFIIHFNYPEQTEWIKTKWKTQFDCEAMLATDSAIHLFTKDWKNFSGAYYKLELKDEPQSAKFVGNLNANALVTGATWDGSDGVYMIGYKDYVPYILKYSNLKKLEIERRYSFSNNYRYQVEGINFMNDTLFITTENSIIDASVLYFVPKD